jgi:hypothetical protein
MQCLNDANMQHMTLTSISIKKCQFIYKKPSPIPEKVEKGVKSNRKLIWKQTYIHTNKKL